MREGDRGCVNETAPPPPLQYGRLAGGNIHGIGCVYVKDRKRERRKERERERERDRQRSILFSCLPIFLYVNLFV